MNYIPSINIEMNTASDFQYIVTENARLVAGAIVNGFNSGQALRQCCSHSWPVSTVGKILL